MSVADLLWPEPPRWEDRVRDRRRSKEFDDETEKGHQGIEVLSDLPTPARSPLKPVFAEVRADVSSPGESNSLCSSPAHGKLSPTGCMAQSPVRQENSPIRLAPPFLGRLMSKALSDFGDDDEEAVVASTPNLITDKAALLLKLDEEMRHRLELEERIEFLIEAEVAQEQERERMACKLEMAERRVAELEALNTALVKEHSLESARHAAEVASLQDKVKELQARHHQREVPGATLEELVRDRQAKLLQSEFFSEDPRNTRQGLAAEDMTFHTGNGCSPEDDLAVLERETLVAQNRRLEAHVECLTRELDAARGVARERQRRMIAAERNLAGLRRDDAEGALRVEQEGGAYKHESMCDFAGGSAARPSSWESQPSCGEHGNDSQPGANELEAAAPRLGGSWFGATVLAAHTSSRIAEIVSDASAVEVRRAQREERSLEKFRMSAERRAMRALQTSERELNTIREDSSQRLLVPGMALQHTKLNEEMGSTAQSAGRSQKHRECPDEDAMDCKTGCTSEMSSEEMWIIEEEDDVESTFEEVEELSCP
eukprot:gnl/MRDRNA2_/MRDRNA2_17451_c0_seq1.p1 gnl/MRDRNA2_/MRDRNA2_17451_c0~~gnl/MRDRNA2_/MRDRNA2_17451_c0_seq1.p1  ORF type:complete len:544 (-),score=140.04 gnl/MRDRNA2_/MRDRNA2_17451_c0_seq1:10-1641(-)